MPELGGPGGPLAPQIFFRSVNTILTREGRLSPPINTGTPNVFHLPAYDPGAWNIMLEQQGRFFQSFFETYLGGPKKKIRKRIEKKNS